jgi:hypothetical protein
MLIFFVLGWRQVVEVSLGELGLANSNINIVVRWLVAVLSDNFVDVSSSASEDFVLAWDVSSVPWEVVLLVVNFSHFEYQIINYN